VTSSNGPNRFVEDQEAVHQNFRERKWFLERETKSDLKKKSSDLQQQTQNPSKTTTYF